MPSARVIPLPAPAMAGPPLANGVVPRERLFARLDGAAGQAVWMVAPAGYGKSSLAASFAQARGHACVWLRASAADNDPASFFAHLSAACGTRLPVPQAEQLTDMAAFARRYFPLLYAALPPAAVLVIDEAEAVAETLQSVLAEAVAAVPQAMRLVITSRAAPPGALARARVEGRLQVLDAAALALTADEVGAMFALRGRTPAAGEVDAVLRRTLGWPAAVSVTLLAGGDRLDAMDDAVLQDYLRHEVWPTFDEATRELLQRVAQLPYLDARLEAAWPALQGAMAMLDRYARRGLFVLTERAEPPRHVMHPLIRDFLQRAAADALAAPARVTLQREAALALAKVGDTEAAIPALLACGAHDRATPLVLALAPRLLSQARLQTLGTWLAGFSPEAREAEPYLEYWLGLVRLMVKPAQAREHLLRAASAFAARGDATGRLRTLAHLAYLSFVDFAPDFPMSRWLADLQEVAPRFDELGSAEEKAQVAMTVVYALLVGEPSHPDLPLWRERVMDALHAPISLQLKVRVASVVGINLLWSGLYEQVGAMHELLAREVAQQGLSDYSQLVWGLVELYACWTQGRTKDAPLVLQRLMATAGQCGIHGLDTFHRLLASDALLAAGRLDDAEALLAEARRHMLPTQLTEVWHAGLQSAWLAGWRGDAQAMLKEARAAINASRAIRSPVCEAYGWIAQALAHRLRGSVADVAATLSTLEPLAARAGSAMVDFHLHDLRAWWARARGDAAAEADALALALPCASRHGMLLPALGCDASLAETAAAALAHGIDPDFVRGWIARRGLPPPTVDELPPDWPHPVRIRLLGGFELVLDGVPLQFDGKVQKRPLELLQALAAHGPEPVSVARLTDDVWPEQDGDAARKSFDVALHRLRKLLGEHAGVLRLEAGALHLDTARVGCDLWDLRRLTDQPAQALAARAAAAAWTSVQARAPLLPTQEAAWCQALRARHAKRMQARFDPAAQM